MKVYVITTGEYSDYRICAVTLDKEKAEKLKKKCDHFDYTGAQIEEYDADECEAFYDRDIYRVIFEQEGRVNTVAKSEPTSYTLSMCKEKPQYDSIGHRLSIYVLADDAEAAIKVAAERRAKYLAEKMCL